MTTKCYRACPTRRAQADIIAIRVAILDVVGDDPPMTVRQVFRQLVARSAERIHAGAAS
jgi:hypothetical protein